MSALGLNAKTAPSILIAMIFIISSISASVNSFEQGINLSESNSVSSATNNSQNDAGSGGDAGNNTTNAVTLTPGNSQSYIGWADDTTDPQDVYEVVIPTGKLLNATMSFPNTNSSTDMDLYLTDTGLNTLDYSWYSNPEGVTTAGTNHSAGGVTVYIAVVAYTGYAQYNLTVHMWTPASANNNQNDAGSGGDAGGAPTNATTLNPGTMSQYNGYGNNNSDILDVYNVSIPSGKNLSASLSHSSGIDFELYLIDSSWTFFIDQSWTSNPETVSTVGTNMSGGGINVYIAVFSSVSAGNYSLTVNIFTNSTQTNSPSITVMMSDKNSASVYLNNLTVGSSYSVDYSVYEYPIGQTGSVTNSSIYFSANATSMWDNKSFSHSDVEGDYGIIAILNSGSGSYLDLDYELIYFEMLQANVTNRTAGSFTASNLTSTNSYSMYWEVYDNSTNTTVDYGWNNFSGVSNYYSALSWTAPSTANEHILETVLTESSGLLSGYHEYSFYPPVHSIMVSSWTNNANATNNTVGVSMSNLNS